MAMAMLGSWAPHVLVKDGLVGVWATDAIGVHDGFVMEPPAAIAAGAKIIGAAASSAAVFHSEEGFPVLSGIAITGEIANTVTEDMAACLVFDFNGTSIAIGLDAGHLAELAAALVTLAREAG